MNHAFNTARLVVGANGVGEDRVAIVEAPSRVVIALADGAGGMTGGAATAQAAIDLISIRAEALNSPAACRDLLIELDDALASGPTGGETTAVIAVMHSDGFYGASVGDSGAWLVDQFGSDDLTLRQIRKPLLGSGTARPMSFERPASAGTLLVATDGLLKYAVRETICRVVSGATNLETVANDLVGLVRLRSGALMDDVGIGLCRASV